MNIVTVSYQKESYAYQVRLTITDDAAAFAVASLPEVQDRGSEVLVRALIAYNTGYLSCAETLCNDRLIKTQNFDANGALVVPQRPVKPARPVQGRMDLRP